MVCAPLLAAVAIAVASVRAVGPPSLLTMSGVLLSAAALGALCLRRALKRAAQQDADAGELASLREQQRAQAAAVSAKRARGRRDAFNEILLGLEARAAEVQRDRDNLEQLVQERTIELQKRNQAMRLVLDNVEQGLATIELDGSLSPERSRMFDQWFGDSSTASGFEEQLAPGDAKTRAKLRLAWEQLTSGFLPLDMSVDQMPRRLEKSGRNYALGYRPIVQNDALQGALLVVNDVTDELIRGKRDVQQRELISVFERVLRDRAGTIEFLEEMDQLVTRASDSTQIDEQQLMRWIHTLKGSCALFGLSSIAEMAHAIESAVEERRARPTVEELSELGRAWSELSRALHRLLGASGQAAFEIRRSDFEALERAIERRTPHAELSAMLGHLRNEPVAARLQRLAEHAQGVARRLGKAELSIDIVAAEELRLPAERWAPFWSALVHVIQNAVDHGVEAPEERRALGKPAAGKLTLSAERERDGISIGLADDGRGIDWERVRERAQARGVSHDSHADLVNALFVDGLSTARGITQVSGRGVGMGAVRAAATELGGTVHVDSRPGEGTHVRFCFADVESRTRVVSGASEQVDLN